MNIKKVDKKRFEEITKTGKPKGQYYHLDSSLGVYMAIDTTRGNIAVRFDNLATAKKYLKSELPKNYFTLRDKLNELRSNSIEG